MTRTIKAALALGTVGGVAIAALIGVATMPAEPRIIAASYLPDEGFAAEQRYKRAEAQKEADVRALYCVGHPENC